MPNRLQSHRGILKLGQCFEWSDDTSKLILSCLVDFDMGSSNKVFVSLCKVKPDCGVLVVRDLSKVPGVLGMRRC